MHKVTFKKVLKNLPGLKKAIIDLYREGGSDVEVRAMIGDLSPDTDMSEELWYRWMEEEPVFATTIKKGKALSESWWYAMGRKHLIFQQNRGKRMDYVGFYMNMKNRFGWSDKQEVTGKGGKDLFNKITVEFKNGHSKDRGNEGAGEDTDSGDES